MKSQENVKLLGRLRSNADSSNTAVRSSARIATAKQRENRAPGNAVPRKENRGNVGHSVDPARKKVTSAREESTSKKNEATSNGKKNNQKIVFIRRKMPSIGEEDPVKKRTGRNVTKVSESRSQASTNKDASPDRRKPITQKHGQGIVSPNNNVINTRKKVQMSRRKFDTTKSNANGKNGDLKKEVRPEFTEVHSEKRVAMKKTNTRNKKIVSKEKKLILTARKTTAPNRKTIPNYELASIKPSLQEVKSIPCHRDSESIQNLKSLSSTSEMTETSPIRNHCADKKGTSAPRSPEKTSVQKSFKSPQKASSSEHKSSFETPSRDKAVSVNLNASPTTLTAKTTDKVLTQSARVLKNLALTDESFLDQKEALIKKSQLSPPKEIISTLYSVIRKQFGQLGGGGSGGPIYGEITSLSFQRVVDCLKNYTGFGPQSVFIDVGAGLGKPSFHVALDPGVRLSLGVEIVGGRWWQSMCILNRLLIHETLKEAAARVFLAHADILDMPNLEEVTHVYSFNRGFPPSAMRGLGKIFHSSKSTKYFICFDKPKRMAELGFELELVQDVTTKMEGSGEQHRCFVYRRTDLDDEEETKETESPTIHRKMIRRSGKSIKANEKFAFIAPPNNAEFAPHVPHSQDYPQGMIAKDQGLDTYREWTHEQIGLNRCDRNLRSKRCA